MNDFETSNTDEQPQAPAASRRVLWDVGVSWYIHTKLLEVREQIDLELQRDDLFQNVEVALRRKRNAITTVLKMVTGTNSGRMGHPLDIEHLVLAEYPPEFDGDEGGMDFYEATTKREARILAKAAEDEGAVTTSYLVVPEAGNTIMVFHPVGAEDNNPQTKRKPRSQVRRQQHHQSPQANTPRATTNAND